MEHFQQTKGTIL